jgi:hypothetical protein
MFPFYWSDMIPGGETYTEINYTYSQVSTDVFGIKTLVSNYRVKDYQNSNFVLENESWKNWRWMDNDDETSGLNVTEVLNKKGLLIPAITNNPLESNPIEKIQFINVSTARLIQILLFSKAILPNISY